MVDIRDWIATHAQRTPKAVAQIDHATGRSFTYSEMDQRVAAIAGHLRHIEGVAIGDVVAVLGDNCSDIFDIDFACGRNGAIFLPLNTRLAAPEIAFQLSDAKPKVMFVSQSYMATAQAAFAESDHSVKIIALDDGEGETEAALQLEDIISQGPKMAADEKRQPSDGWTLIYSSGTTGRPKGVLHTHAGVTMQAIGNCVPLGLSPASCGLTILPLFHISGLNIFGHAMFYAGATQITLDKFDPQGMLEALADKAYGVTHFCAVPTIFEMLAQLPGFKDADLSSVEGAFVGGAPSTEALLKTYAAKNMPLIQGYGLTETGPTITVLDADDAIRKIGSAGKPIMHVDIKITLDDGQQAEPNEVGEILTRGPSVISKYFRRPEAQQSSFRDGWLCTGDMGYFDTEGFLFIIDRKKDMFISGGENVYPAEVENCIAQLNGVIQVAVVGMADKKWGEVGAAHIVKQAGATLSQEDVIEFCQGKIAKYKIPQQVIFHDALPLGGSGKVLKNELRKLKL